MQDYSNTKGKHLTLIERRQIERWHNREHRSGNQIACLLGKAPQTIHHELKRGQVQLKTKTRYSAPHAQEYHSANKSHCGRHSKLTSDLNETISAGVRDKKSLEVILQELTGVCLRTLYHWVDKGWLDVKTHHLLYPHYKKAKKLRKTPPKTSVLLVH